MAIHSKPNVHVAKWILLRHTYSGKWTIGRYKCAICGKRKEVKVKDG
jgi:hypothetical protein